VASTSDRSDIRRIVESVGLDAEEAKLYIAGLRLGSAPASLYARRTQLNRITAYNRLERLVRFGHCTSMKTKNGTFYTPVDPEHLALAARNNAEALERALPELRSLRGASHRAPHVRYFEGVDGMRRVYEDTLTAEKELLNFANSAIVRTHWQTYDEEYVAERVKKKIYLRGIAPNDEEGRRVHGEDKKNFREIRLISAEEFDFDNEINIYDDKVAIVSFGGEGNDLFGVIIESKEVADTQRQIFEMAWRFAGSLWGSETKKEK
jgi:HTH-type transcriptional regulator, sugar sensing transcriptional regulator